MNHKITNSRDIHTHIYMQTHILAQRNRCGFSHFSFTMNYE
uniref:Uncharacterized protein n=1 Tax=Anguilla anguilla TaxID=7936 RepID=A0A0E9RP91_ANGAN